MINKKLYLFDKRIFNPYKNSNVELNLSKAIKEKKIFLEEDKPWEIRFDNSYPNVFYDDIEKIYRCYYHTFTYDTESSDYTKEEKLNLQYKPKHNRIVSLCYAESKDGINWIKPNLGLVEFNGDKNNNIIGHYLHGTSILFDKHELDDNKRYKLFTKIDYGNYMNFIAVAFSKDGIHFDKFIRINGFNPMADTHNHIIYDEKINRYILITRTWRDSLRLPCLSISEDFINWTDTREIMNVSEYENQIYSMPIFLDEDYILGLASIYHEGDQLDENYDTVDLTLTYSYRYNGWNFVNKNQHLIERGKGKYGDGEFDNGCIYASAPIVIDNKIYFYYMGGNGQHTNFRETSLSRAYISKDKYAYWTNKRANIPGTLHTTGFVFLTDHIYLTCEIEENGYVDIEMINKSNENIVHKVKMSKVSKDKFKLEFPFNYDKEVFFLKFNLINAKLYCIEGEFDVITKGFDTALFRG